MRTESVFERPGENFAVARVRREVAGGSDVGAMFIDRSSVGGSDASSNRAYGVDANLRLFGGLRINSYLARTETPGATGDQSAARFGAAYRDRDWNVSALYRRIGDEFEHGHTEHSHSSCKWLAISECTECGYPCPCYSRSPSGARTLLDPRVSTPVEEGR